MSKGKNNPAGSAEIDYSHSSNEIGMYFSKVHNMKDFEEMNPNTKVELGKASETRKNKEYENDYQQSYAQTDEYQSFYKTVPSLHLEEKWEPDDTNNDY